jgi:NADH dehydrogenase [ubiquinone] 1 alpha subcomplex assembly factor 7
MTPERPPATPLGAALAARIRTSGPLSVEDYIQACLHDPAQGYYRVRRAIGRQGDFITAPEISQIFGELIGLWCAVVWQQMGSPHSLRLIELGPGRGTLMRDALRAARTVPGFHDALRVELIEVSAALAAEQHATLAGERVPITWRDTLSANTAPAIVIANEFLDALPLAQFIWRGGRLLERSVGLDTNERLAFVDGEPRVDIHLPADIAQPREDGAIFETRAPAFAALALQFASLGETCAALFIDYGHAHTALGDTLQAVKSHRYDDPLASPGEADLTAQVDFSAFAAAVRQQGLACDGPVPQAAFLGRLGIAERAARLMAANPAKAGDIEMAVARLMAPWGMGSRFKAIGVRGATLAALPGLGPVDCGDPAP